MLGVECKASQVSEMPVARRDAVPNILLARYYGSNLPRFLSPDPLGGVKENPQTFNRYSYVSNNPLNLIDPSGMASIAPDFTESKPDICYLCKIKVKPNTGDKKKDKELRKKIKRDLKQLMRLDPRVKDLIKKLKKSDNVFVITDGGTSNTARPDSWAKAGDGSGAGGTVEYNPDDWIVGRFEGGAGEIRNPEIGLLHELQHASDFDDGVASARRPAEERAVRRENQIRPALGQPYRTTYGGIPVPNYTADP